MKRAIPALLVAASAALDAPAAPAVQWEALRNNDSVRLSVDAASVKRRGDTVTLKYLVEYRQPQLDRLRQVSYRSVVTEARIRCTARTLVLGHSDLYTDIRAGGVLIASAEPTPAEARYSPVEKGTSDEDLWRHACEKRAEAKKP